MAKKISDIEKAYIEKQYRSISDKILEIIKESFSELYPMIDIQNHITSQVLMDKKTFSIMLLNYIILKVSISLKNSEYKIYIDKSYKKYFLDNYEFKEPKSLYPQGYFKITNLDDLKNFFEFYKAFFEDCCTCDIGCCSRYEQCSDMRHCLNTHTDIFMSCGYRRNLEKGIIFYGKNAKSMDRSYKSGSLLDLVNDYIVIDLETTGLSYRYNEIIEIAALKVINSEVVDSFSTLVRPIKKVPETVTDLTGISNEMLIIAPSIEEILPDFKNFIGDNILLGHNINFDIGFLFNAFMEYMNIPLNNLYIDTLSISRFLYPYEKNHKLSDLKRRLNVQSEQAHRALDDVSATLDCYKEMLQYASENNIFLKRTDFVKTIERTYEKRSFPIVSAKDLQPETTEVDKDNLIFGKTFVFTGELEYFSRKEAMQIVLNMGGDVKDKITMKTDFLVLGDNSKNPLVKNGISSKQKQAEEYWEKGYNIKIISETDFKCLIDF